MSTQSPLCRIRTGFVWPGDITLDGPTMSMQGLHTMVFRRRVPPEWTAPPDTIEPLARTGQQTRAVGASLYEAPCGLTATSSTDCITGSWSLPTVHRGSTESLGNADSPRLGGARRHRGCFFLDIPLSIGEPLTRSCGRSGHSEVDWFGVPLESRHFRVSIDSYDRAST